MNKKYFSTLCIFYILGGCVNTEMLSSSSQKHDYMQNADFNKEINKILPTASLLLINGGLTDISVGKMPYYWFNYNEENKKISNRGLPTSLLFESGEKFTIKDPKYSSFIKVISYGNTNNTSSNEVIKNFIAAINNPAENSSLVINTISNDKNNQISHENLGLENNPKKWDKSNIEIPPYILFSYNKKTNSNLKLETPAEILGINKSKSTEDKDYFLAIYPSFSVLEPGQDLAEYLTNFSQSIKSTQINEDADCRNLNRYSTSFEKTMETSRLAEYEVNCPNLKFWLVTYMLSAKAIVYLDKNMVAKLTDINFKPNDNSIDNLLKNISDLNNNNRLEIKYEKFNGVLQNTSTQYFDKNVNRYPLNWSCIDNKCIPAGQDNIKDIPIYAVFNLRSDHLATLINQAPRFYFNNPEIKLIPVNK